jgi:hypothetical protein
MGHGSGRGRGPNEPREPRVDLDVLWGRARGRWWGGSELVTELIDGLID